MEMTMEVLQKMGLASQAAEKILAAFEEMLEENETLAAEKEELAAALAESRKTAAIEKAIWEAGGRNSKAIMALLDLSEISLDEKNGLTGLDLETVKAEAPYLFYEREERTRGTGLARGQKKKANEISEAFQRGLRR